MSNQPGRLLLIYEVDANSLTPEGIHDPLSEQGIIQSSSFQLFNFVSSPLLSHLC